MVRSPVIGITAGIVTEQQDYGLMHRHRVSADYSQAVIDAGGIPIILPPQDGTIDQILELVDGLIFSGGADIDPARYGNVEIHPATYDISEARDQFELELMRAAVQRNVPTLCICRGIQVLNVALGGTLVQHIGDQVESPLTHRQHEAGYLGTESSHHVTFIEESLAAKVFGTHVVPVNSLHHQSLATPAVAIRVEGVSSDGVIEAVSVPTCHFILGVQWHPELLFRTMPEQLKPFEALIEAAKVARAAPAGV
jgi:putative glutamine amidotransferase